MAGISDVIMQLVPFWMTHGQRQQQAEMMKLQQKQIQMNIKEKQQMLDVINSLPENVRASAMLSPKIAGTLLMLTNRGQEQPTEMAIPQPGQIPPMADIAAGGIAAPGPSLPSQIAEGQLGDIGGILGDVLYKELGIGRSSEIVTTETLQHPETGEMVRVPRTRSGEYRWELSQPAPPELATETIKTPTGAEAVMLYDKLRGFRPGGATLPQIMPTAPGTMELPIKTTEMPLWVHPETLESPPPGMSPDEAAKLGYRKVSTEAKKRIDAAKGMREVLVKLGELMRQVFPPSGGVRERIKGAPSRMLGAKTQYNPQAAQLESFINGTVAPIIRSFGEKGNLSETDVKRAINLMPKITDSADVAWGKFNNLIELIDNIQRSAIAGKPGLGLQPRKQIPAKTEDPLGLR